MSEASVIWLKGLLETARTAPALIAFECLGQAEGIVGFALIEKLISEKEHQAYWATINEIKTNRAAARRKLEEVNA